MVVAVIVFGGLLVSAVVLAFLYGGKQSPIEYSEDVDNLERSSK